MSTPSEVDTPRTAPVDHGHQPWNLSRRGWTVLLSFVLVVAFGVVGAVVPVPYVALGPGPTHDTLGDVKGTMVVQIDGRETYPTSGQLRMTTVSVTDDITLFTALGFWVSGRYAIAPREEFIRPGETEEQVEQKNTKLFQDSQSNAEVAALRYLEFPVKVVAQEITTGAPADSLLKPGDRLISVNGKKIEAAEDVRGALQGTTPGQSISITYQRGTEPEKTGSLTLGKASDDRVEGFMGLGPAERADVNFTTTIRLQDIGGPSAGLIFALAIVDRLTPGELENGQVVAGTGEIDGKGRVGAIGGIPFKMVAAREAGATTFLVPADNCAEAKERVPDGLRLVRVETLAGAVDALEAIKDGRDAPSC